MSLFCVLGVLASFAARQQSRVALLALFILGVGIAGIALFTLTRGTLAAALVGLFDRGSGLLFLRPGGGSSKRLVNESTIHIRVLESGYRDLRQRDQAAAPHGSPCPHQRSRLALRHRGR